MPTDAAGTQRASREPRRWLVAALCLSAAVSATLIARSPCVGRDGPTFIWMAQDLSRDFAGTVRAADQHPGYPMLILAAQKAGGVFGVSPENAGWAMSARVVSAVFGLALVTAVWLLGRKVFDERVAGIAAVLVAVLPMFTETSSNVWSDTPHLTFFLLSAWLVVEGLDRRRWGWFLGAGAAAGVAFWIRPEGLTPVVVGGLVLGWRFVRPGEVRARVVLWGLCLGVGAAALVLPYTAVKGRLTAKKDLTKAVSVSALAPVQTQTSVASPVASEGGAAAGASAKPSRLKALGSGAVRMAERVAHGLRYFLIVPLLIALLAPGRRRAQTEGAAFAAVLAGFYVLLLLAVYLTGGYLAGRHVMPLVIVGLIWAAAGIAWVGERTPAVPAKWWPQAGQWPVERTCVAWAAVCVVALLPRSVRPSYDHAVTLRRVSQCIAAQAQPGDALLSNTHWTPFYAGMPERRSPWEFGGLLRSKPEKRYRYIIFYRYEEGWELRGKVGLPGYRVATRDEMPCGDGSVEVFIRK